MRFVLPLSPDMRFDSETPTSRLLSRVMPWMKGRRPAWLIRMGLFLYDHMGGRKILPATSQVSLKGTPEGTPLQDRFATAYEYSDCWVEDSRLVVLNARDALPEGGSIMIRTGVADGEAGGGRLEVVDTGHGMDDATREKIFEPFFTTKKRDKGTGLGLALCADIVRQHKGAIEVQSRRGLGACFSIGLPVNNGLEPSRVESAAPTRSEPASGVRSGRLLFVDDELMLIRAYKRSLAKHYDVVFAEGGQEALDVLAKDDDFDLVVCDLMMPQVDGIRVFEHARQRHPHLVERFLFCSGGAFTPRAREFIATSGNRLLEKPLSPRELDAGIQQALAQVSGTMDAPNLDDELPPFEEGASATRSLS